MLNTMTGGDHYEPGLIDVYPDTLEHLFEFAVGGTGRTIERGLDTAENVLLGKTADLAWDDVPIVRRFYTAAPEWMLRSDYYDAMSDIDMQNDRKKHYQESGDREYMRHLMQENRAVIGLQSQAKGSRKRVSELRKRLVSAQEADDETREKANDKQLELEYKRMLRLYFGAGTRDRK